MGFKEFFTMLDTDCRFFEKLGLQNCDDEKPVIFFSHNDDDEILEMIILGFATKFLNDHTCHFIFATQKNCNLIGKSYLTQRSKLCVPIRHFVRECNIISDEEEKIHRTSAIQICLYDYCPEVS